MAISAGTYQLISSLDGGLIGTNSATKGAPVGDWYTDDSSNLCKVDLAVISGTTCALTLCDGGFGLYYNTVQYYGAGVKLTGADSSNVLQRWDFVQVATVTFRGVSCGVYNIQPKSDATLFLTSSSVGSRYLGGLSVEAAKTDTTGVQGQRWIAYPTKPTDAGLVVPVILGWAETVGGEDAYSRDAAATLYPVWDGGYSWGASTSNYWQGCTRYQTLDGITGAWSEWSDYTAWAPLTATRADNLYWLTAGLDATVTGAKAKRYQIQIRAVGVDSGSETYGYPATATLTANVVPTVTITDATFGPLGLALAFTSDYTAGTTFVEFDVYDAYGVKLSYNSIRSFTGGAYTAIVALDKISAWIDEGSEITVRYAAGTDEYRGWYSNVETHETTLTVDYDGGSGVTLAPVVTMGAGRLLNVSVGSSIANEAVYVRSGGRLVQATKNGDGSFSCIYPFASNFEVYAVAYNDAMTVWGTWEETYTPQSQLLRAYPACHAWSWDGGSFLLEVTSDLMATDRKIDTTNEIVTLDSREYQSVLFSRALESRYTATGVLKHGLTESDKGQLLALLGVKHAYYRAPHGDVANVAITGVSYVDRRSFTEVTVDMVQETR